MVATTANIDKTTRTTRQMAEAQRDSCKERLPRTSRLLSAAASRLANDGLEFMKLQEDNARAAQEWFANGEVAQLQQRNAEFDCRAGWAMPLRFCASRPSTACAPPKPSRGV